MAQAIPAAIELLDHSGWLAILTSLADAPDIQAKANQSIQFHWRPSESHPANSSRILLLGQRAI